jgi:hypothetical protein
MKFIIEAGLASVADQFFHTPLLSLPRPSSNYSLVIRNASIANGTMQSQCKPMKQIVIFFLLFLRSDAEARSTLKLIKPQIISVTLEFLSLINGTFYKLLKIMIYRSPFISL